MKKILVTGSKGFIGRHLCLALSTLEYSVLEADKDSFVTPEILEGIDVIVHLAGINRVNSDIEYQENVTLAQDLVNKLKNINKSCPIIYSSSRKVEGQTAYGKSKLESEQVLASFAKTSNSPLYIYRLDNIYGPGCRANYNSFVSTMCFDVARDIDFKIDDEDKLITLVYIDDLVKEIIRCIDHIDMKDGVRYLEVDKKDVVSLGKIKELLEGFKNSRLTLDMPQISDRFIKDLYSTYLSYLDESDLTYSLSPHIDERGSFVEILRFIDDGQVSLNIVKPGQRKGNHYHINKVEKFLLIKGNIKMTFKRIGEDKEIIYNLSGDKLEVIDIPPLMSHEIINEGKEDAYILMWASDVYQKNNKDTY